MPITMCGNGPCTAEIKNSYRPCANPVITYAGRVLSRHDNNYHDDSDFYALVWDDESQEVKRIDYGSTRFWTYHNGATVDAPAKICALADAWTRKRNAEINAEIAKIDDERIAKEVRVGREVKSLTTRGKHFGVVGIVRDIYEGKYGTVAVIEVAGEDAYRRIPYDRVAVIGVDTTASAE